MKKFLLPLTTALAALLSQSPVSEAHTAGNDQSGDVSRLTDQHKMPVYAVQVPEGISSLVLAKQPRTSKWLVIVPIDRIHRIDPIAPIGPHVNRTI
jgi:hypothetical protein